MKLSDAMEAVIDSYGVNDKMRTRKISPVWSSQNKRDNPIQPRTKKERERDTFNRRLESYYKKKKKKETMRRGTI